MKLNSFFFYAKHLFEMCFYNKFRFFLSVIGLFVGLFVFTTGNILIDSYYKENIKDAQQMDVSTVALRYESLDRIDKDSICKNYSGQVTEAIFNNTKTTIYAKRYQNGSLCSLSAKIAGISNMNDTIPIMSANGELLTAKSSLLKGRLINANDLAINNNVVVIDEFTESLLFPNGDSIGASITFNVSMPGESDVSSSSDTGEYVEKKSCTVIGVIKNSYCSTKENMKYKKFCKNGADSTHLETMIYCPLSYVKTTFDISSQKILIWNSGNIQKIKESLALYKQQSLQEFSLYDILDRNSVVAQNVAELTPLKIFLTLIMVILLFISGINAMNTMFFSIKERINEIGIKKALGATKIDILNQFIMEGMIMAFIASIIAIICSCFIVLLIQIYLNEYMFILFEIDFTLSNLLLPIFVALIYGFVFSVIPCYYGAVIKVTDSLRFE